MLKEIIENINENIDSLGIFDKIYDLCEVVNETKIVGAENDELELTYPAEYQKGGELKKVDLSVVKSVIYSRRNGEVSITENEDFEVGCRTSNVFVIPISYIGMVIRCGADDAYKPERVLTDILQVVNESDNRDLVALIDADSIKIRTTGYNVNKNQVVTEEFVGLKVKYPMQSIIFRLDFDITVETDSACYELSECTCDG